MTGEHVDLTSDGGTFEPDETGRGWQPARRYVGIRFACCDVYTRVYINRQQTAYVGRCPRCLRRAELKVGPGGTDARFFTAY